MATSKKTKKRIENTATWGAAIGLIAASYYFYSTKAGTQKRENLKGWVIKAKGEVIDKIEKLTHIDEKEYRRVVEEVLSKYKKLKSIDPEKVQSLGEDLKKHWARIERETKRKKPGTRKTAKKKSA